MAVIPEPYQAGTQTKRVFDSSSLPEQREFAQQQKVE